MEIITGQTGHLTDEELISGIRDGDKRLFGQIIRRYNQRLFRIGMSVLNNDTDTEEAMQATYIKCYEHLDRFEGRSSFSTWLTRIMLNECFAQRKRIRRHTEIPGEQFENKTAMASPARIMINKELNLLLESTIAGLPEKYRLVFVLREIEEMSVRETGEILEIEESNVKVRLNRAKTLLKRQLSGYVKDNIYDFHLTRCDRIAHNVMTRLQIND